MKFCTIAATALGAALSGLSASNAAMLLIDNFDGYADQAAFEAAWPVVTAPSGTLSTAQSVSPPNSVHYAANTANVQRNGRSFTESGLPAPGNLVSFSFDYYDSDAAAAPYRQFSNLQDSTAPSGNGQLVSMGLNNNLTSAAEGGNFYMARILGFNAGAYFKLNDGGAATLRITGWHNLKVVIGDLDFKFYVDNILAKTIAQLSPLRSYDHVRMSSGLSATREVYYDNMRVETIPEPASLILVSAGVIGCLTIGRRRG